MADSTLTVAAFLSVLVFLVVVMRYELGLSLVVSGLLGVSVLSVGLLFAVGLVVFLGLSLIQTTMVLGLAMLGTTVTYMAVS